MNLSKHGVAAGLPPLPQICLPEDVPDFLCARNRRPNKFSSNKPFGYMGGPQGRLGYLFDIIIKI